MKALFVCVTGVALSLCVASNAQAQVMGGRGYYANTRMGTGVYSGGMYSSLSGYSRFGAGYSSSTGYSHFGVGINPWSSRYSSGGAFANPYSSTFGYARSSYNSRYYNTWMGRYGYRSRNR
jgi:hypothetical protein